jgi:hypothetical protein
VVTELLAPLVVAVEPERHLLSQVLALLGLAVVAVGTVEPAVQVAAVMVLPLLEIMVLLALQTPGVAVVVLWLVPQLQQRVAQAALALSSLKYLTT